MVAGIAPAALTGSTRLSKRSKVAPVRPFRLKAFVLYRVSVDEAGGRGISLSSSKHFVVSAIIVADDQDAIVRAERQQPPTYSHPIASTVSRRPRELRRRVANDQGERPACLKL